MTAEATDAARFASATDATEAYQDSGRHANASGPGPRAIRQIAQGGTGGPLSAQPQRRGNVQETGGLSMTAPIFARVPSRVTFLLAFATLDLGIALAIAWVLGVTLFFPSGRLAAAIVERADLIRGHIDFLMMSQFLFIFALLFRQYRIIPPLWVIAASCFGAFVNPFSFVMRAMRPKVDPSTVVEHFPALAAVSFTLTTVGFLACAALAARAAWREAGRTPHPTVAELETL
jgi:hypothetical protein